jgi:putative transcription antitermination factor YqgF
MTHLCIDYGLAHCGLALGIEHIAEPLETVATAQALKRIEELVKIHQPQRIVIGLSEGDMAEKTKRFAESLQATMNIPIAFQDETLTSQEVRQQMAQSGMKRSRREAKIDHLVAARILQDYLDTVY